MNLTEVLFFAEMVVTQLVIILFIALICQNIGCKGIIGTSVVRKWHDCRKSEMESVVTCRFNNI